MRENEERVRDRLVWRGPVCAVAALGARSEVSNQAVPCSSSVHNTPLSQPRDRSSYVAIAKGFDVAIDQARRAFGATSPNPVVGCALLDRFGEILVVAAHLRTGGAHAEVLALGAARAAGCLDRAYRALVTLEPCNHYGRTPPCSEALRDSPVQEVWVGVNDPNPIAGGGNARLMQAPHAKRVVQLSDVPELAPYYEACSALIAPFSKRIAQGKAWISVKQAVQPNGDMHPPAGRTTFTSKPSLVLAHRLRKATDAIITGAGTILTDAPRFDVRLVPDHPDRAARTLVICDRSGRITPQICDDYVRRGFDVVLTSDLSTIPELLAQRQVNWAMLEAGPSLLCEIQRLGLWDDWLTIATQPALPDRWDVRSHGITPLRFVSGLESLFTPSLR